MGLYRAIRVSGAQALRVLTGCRHVSPQTPDIEAATGGAGYSSATGEEQDGRILEHLDRASMASLVDTIRGRRSSCDARRDIRYLLTRVSRDIEPSLRLTCLCRVKNRRARLHPIAVSSSVVAGQVLWAS